MFDLNNIVNILASSKITPPGLSIDTKGAEVSVSFPRNHPMAEKFLALAQELATIKRTPAGIEYNTGPNQGNVDKLMKLLREIVDTNLLESELKRQGIENTMNLFNKEVRKITQDPYTMNKAILGTAVAQSIGMSANDQQRMANIIAADEPKFDKDSIEDIELPKPPTVTLPDEASSSRTIC